MFLPPESAAPVGATPTIASALTLLAVVAQGVTGHLKARKRSRATDAQGTQLTRIEGKLDRFAEEQREINREFDRRITDVDHIVRGVDGENGVRGRVKKLEEARQTEVDAAMGAQRERMLHGGLDRRVGT